MIRRPPRSTLSSSSAASDVYKRQACPSPRWGASWVWRSRRLPDSRPGAMSPRWQHWRALPEVWALSSTSTSRPQPLGCERRHDKPSLTVQPSRPLGGTLRRRENERRGCPPTPDVEHRNGAGPVSYTHLTLPTKRIV